MVRLGQCYTKTCCTITGSNELVIFVVAFFSSALRWPKEVSSFKELKIRFPKKIRCPSEIMVDGGTTIGGTRMHAISAILSAVGAICAVDSLGSTTEAELLQFQVCTFESGGGARCVPSASSADGRQSVEIQIPGNSFNTISVASLLRRDVEFKIACAYRDHQSNDIEETVVNGTACPHDLPSSAYIEQISLGLVGKSANNYIVGYQCWTSKLGDRTKVPQPIRIWDGNSSAGCGEREVNQWISGVLIYTFGYPQFP
jgi:hypothetical protein